MAAKCVCVCVESKTRDKTERHCSRKKPSVETEKMAKCLTLVCVCV